MLVVLTRYVVMMVMMIGMGGVCTEGMRKGEIKGEDISEDVKGEIAKVQDLLLNEANKCNDQQDAWKWSLIQFNMIVVNTENKDGWFLNKKVSYGTDNITRKNFCGAVGRLAYLKSEDPKSNFLERFLGIVQNSEWFKDSIRLIRKNFCEAVAKFAYENSTKSLIRLFYMTYNWRLNDLLAVLNIVYDRNNNPTNNELDSFLNKHKDTVKKEQQQLLLLHILTSVCVIYLVGLPAYGLCWLWWHEQMAYRAVRNVVPRRAIYA